MDEVETTYPSTKRFQAISFSFAIRLTTEKSQVARLNKARVV
jgi:hypothetical protein